MTFVDNGNGTATLSGTPAAGTAKTYTLKITAKNAAGSVVQTLLARRHPDPRHHQRHDRHVHHGQVRHLQGDDQRGSGAGAVLHRHAARGVNFVDNGNGTATLSGTPAAGTGGTYPLTITATNSAGTAHQSFTLVVNQLPAFTSAATATATVGQASSFTVTTSGYPTPR